MRKTIIHKICKNCNVEFETVEPRSVFCSRKCAAIFNNPKREIDSLEYTCEKCGTPFKKKYKIRNGRKIHCDKCKRVTRPKKKREVKSIAEVSKRTISKIIQRMDLGCSACGWKECVGDIHHIKHKKYGGTDEHTNLTYLCPNCHRKMHNNMSVEYKTFYDQVGDSWKNYYNVSKHCTSV